ncbi:class I SAM-dependent methyltransferase [Pseudidiomarina sediminum]|uniref:Class I SAM-dependent methyltransferase n=1 Tax=Pseudidiomarina sediminum TaxID=431675 RepID=A0A432ZAS0_9GAMM|nr:class I SAM-dependent methyltransferase [Pseudidiomarina sediminum]MBY6064275.1 class I SAM-dependent methyltransferase [Pseudidiomarina sediminum]RUO75057.1 class I SAM-dependent methyltransferase [Pseudidiomarina sediminum]
MNNPWDERYNTEDYIYGTAPNDFLHEHAAALLNSYEHPHVLCVADGEGRNSVYLAELGATVCAMDISQVGLDKAQHLAQQRGVKLQTQCIDLSDALLPEQHYDGVVAIFCHLPSAARAHLYEQIAASLKPGGFFLLEGYSHGQLHYNTGGPDNADLLLNCAELTRAFKGFEIQINHAIEREIHEGDRHSGLGAVCQFIAKKPHVREQRYQFTANRSKASHKLRYVESSASTDGDCTLCKGPLTSDD